MLLSLTVTLCIHDTYALTECWSTWTCDIHTSVSQRMFNCCCS